ncbi:MAG: Gfo/Idh/MocA family oxidoreductase [Anaerolineae bacterium]|nr:Gfo/Idh/MocA family oxidoreductase [Anaerolineae bacterium]
MPEPIRLALVGAGIFARDAHIPALHELRDRFEIVAVYSRTRASAEALLPLLPGTPDIYTDLAPLLQRQDIDAVDILLPIEALPAAIDLALAAGKHVVSEKPIAPDIASGRRLLTDCHTHPQVWMVAENVRYTPAFRRAAEIVRSGEIGQLMMVNWAVYASMTPSSKYYHTEWRRSGTFPGGFLLDGGVHNIAALRLVVGEIVSVSAEARQIRPDLPPMDTLSAALQFEGGVIGSFSITFAGRTPLPSTFLTVVGDTGMVRVNHATLEVTTEEGTLNESVTTGGDIEAELAAFADAIRDGTPHVNTPLEALRDVAALEAMFAAVQTGQRTLVEQFRDLA